MKNPKECFSLCQNQTFFILNRLAPPDYKDGSEPLLFHHDTFSRFVFVIINASKKAVTANIPVSAIPAIIEKIKNLNFRDSILLPTFQKDEHTAVKSPAYATIISSGTLKGKNPCGSTPGRCIQKQNSTFKPAKMAPAKPVPLSTEP